MNALEEAVGHEGCERRLARVLARVLVRHDGLDAGQDMFVTDGQRCSDAGAAGHAACFLIFTILRNAGKPAGPISMYLREFIRAESLRARALDDAFVSGAFPSNYLELRCITTRRRRFDCRRRTCAPGCSRHICPAARPPTATPMMRSGSARARPPAKSTAQGRCAPTRRRRRGTQLSTSCNAPPDVWGAVRPPGVAAGTY